MGWADAKFVHESGKAEIAYLCDVDERRAADSIARFPNEKYDKDFREMFDKEHRHRCGDRFDSRPQPRHPSIVRNAVRQACVCAKTARA